MSNDCRTKCKGCGHYVDLVAGTCPVCDETYYNDSEEVIDKRINITILIDESLFDKWNDIRKEIEALIPKKMSTERFNFTYTQPFSGDEF